MRRIRQAAPADEPSVREIVQAAYAPWIERIGMRPPPMDADYPRLLADERIWLLEEPALIVLIPEPAALLVDNVAVHPAVQGQGLGRALLAFAEDQARTRSLPALRLYTHHLMTANITLYERLGYTRTGTEGPALHLTKPL